MNDEEKAFRAALKDDWCDLATHRVFADWLEEHGRDDEARLHRQWTSEAHKEAEEFLSEMAKLCTSGEETGDYRTGKTTTLADLIVAGYKHLATGDSALFLPFDTPDELYSGEYMREFWKHFRTLTCLPTPDEDYDMGFTRCGC